MKKVDWAEERLCSCALNLAFGQHPRVAVALMEHLGGAAAVMHCPPGELNTLLGPSVRPEYPLDGRLLHRAEEELRGLEKIGGYYVCLREKAYPALLRECQDPPVGLYVRSDSPPEELFPPHRRYLSVVGTRDMSAYGGEWCRRLIGSLAATGADLCIVSGLAYGVDATAHRSALQYGLPTLAVMASGADRIYPWRHAGLAFTLAESPGCGLLTDYPLGTAPLALNFLRRNRIIAGLSEATVVVESRRKGGSMITARLASSYGRDLYALPGRADDERSQGCNLLIAEKLADSLPDGEFLVRSLRLRPRARKNASGTSPAGMRPGAPEAPPAEDVGQWSKIVYRMMGESVSARERAQMTELMTRIVREPDLDSEALSARCGLPCGQTGALLTLLESKGLVAPDLLGRYRPGPVFEL